MRTRNGIQFSTYLPPRLLDWLRAKSKRNTTSVSSELRVILEAAKRADDAVRSEVERCLC